MIISLDGGSTLGRHRRRTRPPCRCRPPHEGHASLSATWPSSWGPNPAGHGRRGWRPCPDTSRCQRRYTRRSTGMCTAALPRGASAERAVRETRLDQQQHDDRVTPASHPQQYSEATMQGRCLVPHWTLQRQTLHRSWSAPCQIQRRVCVCCRSCAWQRCSWEQVESRQQRPSGL